MLKAHKNRLIVGDGNFSYTRSFLKKRAEEGKQDLAEYLTTSEKTSESELQHEYKQNVEEIKLRGAKVLFEIDATKLNEYQSLIDTRYQRIHFNCPCPSLTGISSLEEQNLKIRSLMESFFKSASMKQEPDDKIYVTIPRAENRSRDLYFQGIRYGLYNASKSTGYTYIKKRKFCSKNPTTNETNNRYKYYQHKKTGDTSSVSTAENSREYIFKKLSPNMRTKSPIKYSGYECLNAYDSDTSSGSSCYSSDENIEEGLSFLFKENCSVESFVEKDLFTSSLALKLTKS